MFGIFLFVAIAFAILNWIAEAKNIKILIYIAKPATMLALIAWMVFEVGLSGPLIFFTLGLCFSLAGDVFLMLPRDLFIAGLVAFLIAHVCYIVGFNYKVPPITVISLIMVIIVFVVAILVIRPLRTGLLSKGQQALLLPVQIYAGVISLMLLSALVTLVRPDWDKTAAILVCVGAAFFYLSDTLIAWNKFVKPVSRDRLKVMVTYHVGQVLIALGAALQFMK